jgi:hypothetical protein
LVASLAFTVTIGTTLGAVNLARLTGTWGFLSHPAVWTHGYAQTFGFFALFIMGFAYHAVPRFVAAPLAWPGLVAASLWLQVAGLLAVTLGWLFLPGEAHRLWTGGSLGFVLASGAFLVVILGTLRHRTRPAETFERWATAGAAWLVVGSILALRAALGDDVGWTTCSGPQCSRVSRAPGFLEPGVGSSRSPSAGGRGGRSSSGPCSACIRQEWRPAWSVPGLSRSLGCSSSGPPGPSC